ncbi:MAG: 30S ribosomal protein S6 [Gemmatimonadota bacterium]
MRDYEIVYIFRSSLTAEAIEEKLERFHAVLTARDGGQITAVEHWGKRQLAYPIRKETSGFYVVAQFTADPEVLPELEHILKLDEDLLRHLVVLSEGELAVAPSAREDVDAAPARRPRVKAEDAAAEEEDEEKLVPVEDDAPEEEELAPVEADSVEQAVYEQDEG